MYLQMLLGGLIGIALQTLVKVRNMNTRLPNETFVSVFKTYWSEDFASVLLSILTVAGSVFISSEWLGEKLLGYAVASYIKTSFVVVGYCANSVVSAFLGTTEKKLKDKSE